MSAVDGGLIGACWGAGNGKFLMDVCELKRLFKWGINQLSLYGKVDTKRLCKYYVVYNDLLYMSNVISSEYFSWVTRNWMLEWKFHIARYYQFKPFNLFIFE